jgi:Flp pilus assembly protein TadG
MVILLFVVITLGIMDFGRMLMIMNVITHATRDGARTAAFFAADQFAGGALSGSNLTAVQNRVRGEIASVMTASDANAFAVTSAFADQGTGAGPAVSVTVTGNVPFMFSFPGLWGGSIAINRVATFRFEGTT